MTKDELLTRMNRLLPAQFEEVLFRAGIPLEYISSAGSAQAQRAVDVLRYIEPQNELGRLARILEAVAGPGSTAGNESGGAKPSAPSLAAPHVDIGSAPEFHEA